LAFDADRQTQAGGQPDTSDQLHCKHDNTPPALARFAGVDMQVSGT
jgi:hypothetical protein